MEKPPVTTLLIHSAHPRQDQLIALLTVRPRDKTELMQLMNLKKTNLKKVLLTLISKGVIIPNPVTKKYEIHPKNL